MPAVPAVVSGRSDMLEAVETAQPIDAAEVVERLKTALFKSRIRIADFFSDFDPLRSGTVTEAKFRTAMTIANIMPLTEREMQVVSQRYADATGNGLINYKELLNDIECVFVTKGMERDPHSSVGDFTASLKSLPTVLPPAQSDACDAVVARLAHIVKVRGIPVRDPFHDSSRNFNSPLLTDQVTYQQFSAGLSNLGLQVSAEELQALQEGFPGSVPGYVNYNEFVCAVEPNMKIFSVREPRSHVEQPLKSGFRAEHVKPVGLAQPGRPPLTSDEPRYMEPLTTEMETLIKKLQSKAITMRVRLQEFFRDFDKHNDGSVSVPQFIRALSVAYKHTCPLSAAEVQLLLGRYSVGLIDGDTKMKWREFCAEIDAVFNKKAHPGHDELMRNPAAMPDTTYLQQDVKELHPPEREQAVQQLLADLRERVRVRRIIVKPMFADYGHCPAGVKVVDHITRAQFAHAFSRFNVELSNEQQGLLFERYDTLSDGMVNYVALVRDIDPNESFSSRRTTHHVLPQDPDFSRQAQIRAATGYVPPGGFKAVKYKDPMVLGEQPGRQRYSNDMPGAAAPSPELGSLLARLHSASSRHRVRLEEGFRDFDRHRDGTVTMPQFTIGLQSTLGKLEPLSHADFALIVDYYSIPVAGATHIRWKDFCADIAHLPPKLGDGNAREGVRAAEYTGMGKSSRIDSNDFVASVKSAHEERARSKGTKSEVSVLDAEQEAAVCKCLDRFQKLVETRRLNVRPFFADMQHSRRSMNQMDHVSRTQFAQCLSALSLEASASELELLVRKFDDLGDGFVNYVAFVRAVEREGTAVHESSLGRDAIGRSHETAAFHASGGYRAAKVADVQPGRAPPVADFPQSMRAASGDALGLLLSRLRMKVKQFHLGVHDFFVDKDRHRNGVITPAEFRAGLDSAFLQSYMHTKISNVEVALLEAQYYASFPDGKTGVAWRRFCDDVDVVRTIPHLEYSPVQPTMELEIERSNIPLDGAEETRLHMLLEQLRTRFRVLRVPVKAPFHDFAKSKNSPLTMDHVTRQQFIQGLATLGVKLKEEDAALLFRKFDDDGEATVNYVAFCREVDEVETHSNRSAQGAHENSYSGFSSPHGLSGELGSAKWAHAQHVGGVEL